MNQHFCCPNDNIANQIPLFKRSTTDVEQSLSTMQLESIILALPKCHSKLPMPRPHQRTGSQCLCLFDIAESIKP